MDTTTYTPQEIMDRANNHTTLAQWVSIVILRYEIESAEQDLDTSPTTK